MKRKIGTLIAVGYFIFFMGLVMLFLVFTPLMFFSDVSAIRKSGFAGPDDGVLIIGACGLFIGLSLIIPALRRVYEYFPWLFAFIKIFFISMIILTLGISILNFGYKTVNPIRHTVFYIVMILFVIGGRLAMSVYFKWNPVNIEKRRN